jgi:hypothetical protein
MDRKKPQITIMDYIQDFIYRIFRKIIYIFKATRAVCYMVTVFLAGYISLGILNFKYNLYNKIINRSEVTSLKHKIYSKKSNNVGLKLQRKYEKEIERGNPACDVLNIKKKRGRNPKYYYLKQNWFNINFRINQMYRPEGYSRLLR